MKSFNIIMILAVLIVASIALTGVASAVPAGTSDNGNNISTLVVINDGSGIVNHNYNTYIDQGSMDDAVAIYNNTTGTYTFSQSWVTGFFNSLSNIFSM